jgi:hypothetical protein
LKLSFTFRFLLMREIRTSCMIFACFLRSSGLIPLARLEKHVQP